MFKKRKRYKEQFEVMHKHMSVKFGELYLSDKKAIKRIKAAAKLIAKRF